MTIPTDRAYLQTRGTGRAGDYAFLGEAPAVPWWRAYRELTAFEHPTLLVVADGSSWQAYLSGIPSARTDAVGTVVRYTLALTGGAAAASTDCALAAVAAWVDDVAAAIDGALATAVAPSPGALSAALDARFPADEVDRLIAARTARAGVGQLAGGDEDAERVVRETRRALGAVEDRVVAALRSLPPRSPGELPDDRPDDWLGAVADPAARAAFVARVATLLHGRPGRALLLNLVGGPGDAAALLDPAYPVAVLVDGAAPARVTPLRGEVDPKKARARRAGAGTTRAATTRSGATAGPARTGTWSASAVAVATAVLAVVIAVLAAVVLLLL
jgi:hypothetical protein